jgi:hypothetical protein
MEHTSMKIAFGVAALGLVLASPAFAQGKPPSNPLINYDGFVALTAQTAPIRAKRLLSLEAFRAFPAN